MASPSSAPPPASSSPFRVTAAGKTDVGRVRDHNEDKLLLSPELGLFVVADGMGGHNAGEVASALAALSLENCYRVSRTEPLPSDLTEDPRPLSHDARCLLGAARKANSDVFEISKTHAEHKGMGTTLVAVAVSRPTSEISIAHVGDSRCYRVRGGKIEQLTRDHSLVGDALAWKPDLTEAEIALLPKNIISRALGRGTSVEID
ncbi:MAG TPA: protein phosphatase 2C domain-containing protein, partial [Polyangiaceae bacterium]